MFHRSEIHNDFAGGGLALRRGSNDEDACSDLQGVRNEANSLSPPARMSGTGNLRRYSVAGTNCCCMELNLIHSDISARSFSCR